MTPALWSIALVRILLAQLAFGFSWCLYLVAPKFLATELSLGPAEIGSVGMTSGAVSAISVLLIVRSIDHSRRTLFVRGCALLSLSSLLYVFVERFGPIVYLLSAGISVSYALAFNAAMASVTDVVPEARLGQAFGLQSAANLSMNAVSSMTAEHIAQHYGWRWVFASAAVGSIGSLLLGLGLPRARSRPTSCLRLSMLLVTAAINTRQPPAKVSHSTNCRPSLTWVTMVRICAIMRSSSITSMVGC